MTAAIGAMCLAASRPAQATSAACTATNFVTTSAFPTTTTGPSGAFEAGEIITITVTPGGPTNLTNGTYTFPDDVAVVQAPVTSASHTLAAAATGAASVNVSGILSTPYTIAFTCTGNPSVGGSTLPTAGQQMAQNAQTAITNGKLSLQQTSDATRAGVLGGFSPPTTNRNPNSAYGVTALTGLPARARRDRHDREAATETVVQQRDQQAREQPGDMPTSKPRDPSVRLGRNDLLDFCSADDGDCEGLGDRWNVWLDGRGFGIVDQAQQQNSTGLVGQVGADYKVMPWLALGLSVGVESFQTQIVSTQRIGTTGVSAIPYVGVRLDANMFLTAFFGVTNLTYNTVPGAGLIGSFEAWRLMGGGSLSGLWRLDAWRFQPTVALSYASETQNAYTNSAGTQVPGQTVTYGRASLGPEIGYSFSAPDRSWTIEPFVTGRANLDFGDTSAVRFNGVQIAARGQGSGSAGAGVAILTVSGLSMRLQGSYDSIGVSGLDIWTAMMRGGWSF